MIVYTDGSYNRKNYPNFCGFSAIILNDDKSLYGILYGGSIEKDYVKLWNVGGEILAIQNVLYYLKNLNKFKNSELNIYHDYLGLSEWANRKWKAKNNITKHYVDFIQYYRNYFPINFHLVKGHSNNYFNDLADNYAKRGITLAAKEKRTIVEFIPATSLEIQ